MRIIKVIGVGGIGTNLLFLLGRHLNNQKDNRLVLIDGDEFEEKNGVRQDFINIGNKAKIKAEEMAVKFPNLSVRAIPEFVTKENIGSIIEAGDLVFLAVDNHATRKLVSDYCCALDDVVLISGGNELYDGNVQIHLRQGGRSVTRPITDFHPEISKPQDRSPGEMSCEERANQPGSRQILVANAGAAWLMYVDFFLCEENRTDLLGELYFDILGENNKVVNRRRVPNG